MKPQSKPIHTYVLDLFCGAGGTSTAIFKSNTNISVMACINHDKNAIISHAANYPGCLHFTEDIRTIDLDPIWRLMKKLRKKNPTCRFAIWASLECTNFSKAKGGPKNPDSRTLAEHLFRYLDYLPEVDFLWIENVEEFITWGPLDATGNPDKTKAGESFKEWTDKLITDYFKVGTWGTYVSADFGGYTIRKRLFMQFAKEKILAMPIKTHSEDGLSLPKWQPVKDVLDLHLHGNSMFERKKNFVPNTHRRILKGLKKFGGRIYGYKYYGQDGFQDINEPSATLTTKDRISLVQPICLTQNFGSSSAQSLEKPAWALTTKDHAQLVQVKPIFLKHDYGESIGSSLDDPGPTLPGNPAKFSVVSVQFLHNPQYGGSNWSTNRPAFTLIARQDKAPAGLTTVTAHMLKKALSYSKKPRGNKPHIIRKDEIIIYVIYPDDDKYLKEIKQYMHDHNLDDILVRPLTIAEMLRIQGFPNDYILKGTETEKKKYIGNSVEVNVGIALFKAIDNKIQKT